MFLIINNFSFQCFDFQSIIHKQCFVNKFFFDFQSIFNDYFLFIFFPPSLLDCGIILEISLLTTIWKSSALPLLIMASLILILPTITDLNREGPYGNWGSRKYLIASLDQSLQRLGLDYVDISSFHAEKKSLPSYLSIGRAFSVCSYIINVQDLQIYTPFQIIDLNGSTKETFGMRDIEQTFN